MFIFCLKLDDLITGGLISEGRGGGGGGLSSVAAIYGSLFQQKVQR